MIKTQIQLFCGFCGHQDTYTKKTSDGTKGKVSGSILCNKCGRQLNHNNTWK